MEFVELLFKDRGYSYQNASNKEMFNLGIFLSTDVGCGGRTFFRDWALSDENAWAVGGDATTLEKEGDYIYLTDQHSQEKVPTELKIGIQQFVKLLNDWQEKVCKTKPKEVIIKYENDEFIIETKD